MRSEPTALSSHNNELLAPRQLERLSRSPHPYHRSHHDINQDSKASAGNRNPGAVLPRINTSLQLPEHESPIAYFDADYRKRRKDSTSPSDSGTEADDEKGAFLTGLPAPPPRPRKGLKEGYGTSSPLLTPSYLDDANRTAGIEANQRRRASFQSQASTDDETTKLREKFTRKRRAELIRRITETLLLGFIVYIAIGRAFQITALPQFHRLLDALPNSGAEELPIALLAYSTILPGLYCLYPIRIILKNHSRSLCQNKAWYYIHIPAAFDPAALLYPTVIPLVVALSLNRSSLTAVYLNISLGIASIPSKLIPFNDHTPWYDSVQGILSAAPVLIAERARKHDSGQAVLSTPMPSINIEVLLCSYLLHQALMPVLEYLTTTSLLPAELQLLSASLINLLFLATSPQAVILKALLWIGGLSLLVLCGKVLSWEVALARVPSWRFRRPPNRSRSWRQPGVIKALDDSVNGSLSSWGLIPTDPENSDSDAPAVQPNISTHKIKMQLTTIDSGMSDKANGIVRLQSRAPLSAIRDKGKSGFLEPEGTIEIPQAPKTNQRRFTLPSYVGSPSEVITRESLRRNKTGKSTIYPTWSFQYLTSGQATLISWGFAAYVYTVVALLILFPIRQYIGVKALGGHEPVGWALGYMFGNIRWTKSLIKGLALDQWVLLPEPADSSLISKSFARADYYGQAIGVTNVRLLICLYCLSIIAAGLAIVFRLSTVVEVDTRRKVFHGMMVLMFLPTIFVDPTFVSLALALILAIFLLLDLFRASQLPPLSKPLTFFLAPYVDGRDHRGPVIVSHIFLLIGCAIPLWLSLAATLRKEDSLWQGWDIKTRDMSMTAGVICVGMGDAAASLVGRRFGRRRWPWSGGKSLEGSIAFAIAVVCGLASARAWLLVGGWAGDSGEAWVTTVGKAGIAGCGASLTEAVLTGGNDNVIVPVILWLLVRGLEM